MTRTEKIGFIKGLTISQTAQLYDATDTNVMKHYKANLAQIHKLWQDAMKSGKPVMGKSAIEWREILTNLQNKLV